MSVAGWDDPLQFVRGVGPRRAAVFEALGLRTVGDLIEYLPFRFDHVPRSIPIGHLVEGQTATLVGELRNVNTRGPLANQRVTATLVDGTGRCRLTWFNSAFLVDKLHHGLIVRVTGKIEAGETSASLTNPQWTPIEKGEEAFVDDKDHFLPVYSATAELPSKQIAKVIDGVLDDALRNVVDFLPPPVLKRHAFPPRAAALRGCHRPDSAESFAVARRRFAYEEFLLCQLAAQASRRHTARISQAFRVPMTEEIDRRIRARLPFELTPGQNQAVAEIVQDLAQEAPMNRLLQADVGAGKTAVALFASLAVIAARRQVAWLAPTEVLAAQHHARITEYLGGSRVRVEQLSGSTPKAQRARILDAAAGGRLDLLVGTHAVLEDVVQFRDLALVVIDEQQKFGVAQRSALRRKGRCPHTLVLTATPIPRTLALTVFGDLDVSSIRDLPPGRQPVETRLVTPDLEERAWGFVRQRLAAGEQAYIVYPLVEESDAIPLKAATTEVERLGAGVLSGFRLGLLHGRLKPEEKQKVMDRFKAGEVQVLVSTTAVEVGVDVAGATLMIVQHAERFGLSQLHQLRGRVGRGDRKSYCLLYSHGRGENAAARLGTLCATHDGFRIAEEDLRLRGPGEVLGTRQHGVPLFKVADPVGDFDLLTAARDDAAALLRDDPDLARPEHRQLRQAMLRRYAAVLPLADVA
jgi:ATP-dependent DNA helicase RecG